MVKFFVKGKWLKFITYFDAPAKNIFLSFRLYFRKMTDESHEKNSAHKDSRGRGRGGGRGGGMRGRRGRGAGGRGGGRGARNGIKSPNNHQEYSPLEEENIFSNNQSKTGINFTKYEEIPVKCEGEKPPCPVTSLEEAGLCRLVMDNVIKVMVLFFIQQLQLHDRKPQREGG